MTWVGGHSERQQPAKVFLPDPAPCLSYLPSPQVDLPFKLITPTPHAHAHTPPSTPHITYLSHIWFSVCCSLFFDFFGFESKEPPPPPYTYNQLSTSYPPSLNLPTSHPPGPSNSPQSQIHLPRHPSLNFLTTSTTSNNTTTTPVHIYSERNTPRPLLRCSNSLFTITPPPPPCADRTRIPGPPFPCHEHSEISRIPPLPACHSAGPPTSVLIHRRHWLSVTPSHTSGALLSTKKYIPPPVKHGPLRYSKSPSDIRYGSPLLQFRRLSARYLQHPSTPGSTRPPPPTLSVVCMPISVLTRLFVYRLPFELHRSPFRRSPQFFTSLSPASKIFKSP
ncbi:hypothetical protein BZA05DRAFT_129320 [Tricharina praecox]|uniref:uncharacterized protein n=1 Tax=Tricharina praecox TaxID=43433 RepID=UPI00221F79D6|nr:uncharacterized protein BZA05DRAFT_129320 [Tricharina praecox]KAI5846879.1 hypothetical protein BZA05DRAFT_129320 [Tricharina praecox]